MKYKHLTLKAPGKSFRGPMPLQYLGALVSVFDAEKDKVTIYDNAEDIIVQCADGVIVFPNSDVDYKIPLEVTRAVEKGK